MKIFKCACGAQLFFENSQCLTCGSELGFLPDELAMLTLAPGPEAPSEATPGRYRKCANYLHEGVCNWLLSSESESELCQACELNHVIPDLSKPENHERWSQVEKAKRRLVYSLNWLGLRVLPKRKDAERGLSFDIKESQGSDRVLTGHSDGLITLNLNEADAAEREQVRLAMKERYRTMLGHFRHEVGHYFWDRLVQDGEKLDAFRQLFGDERVDYSEALRAHYAKQQESSYSEQFISHYAASHPSEDFAETFAHYLHMVDTLETAAQFGFTSAAADRFDQFDALMSDWYPLSVALNSLNRSMGLQDAYPFAISATVRKKLGFVHELISGGSKIRAPQCDQPSAPAGAEPPGYQ